MLPPGWVASTMRPLVRGARAQFPDADHEDVLLLEDLLGIADPEVALAKVDPDARRRRLTALINAASLARKAPAVYVVEDLHWIDEASESLIADFVAVVPQTHSLVLINYRPEYRGALSRVPGAQSIALGPLSDPETAALVMQLLGPDRSVGGLATRIAERAAGNPFFAEEMVRDLAERGVLTGARGNYACQVDHADAAVPATPAGDYRRPYRSARPRRQADSACRCGDRVAVWCRAVGVARW